MGRFLEVRRIGRVDATEAGTLVPIVREADQIQNSRGDRTSIELFLTSLSLVGSTSQDGSRTWRRILGDLDRSRGGYSVASFWRRCTGWSADHAIPRSARILKSGSSSVAP